jgi:hypothetical protein
LAFTAYYKLVQPDGPGPLINPLTLFAQGVRRLILNFIPDPPGLPAFAPCAAVDSPLVTTSHPGN